MMERKGFVHYIRVRMDKLRVGDYFAFMDEEHNYVYFQASTNGNLMDSGVGEVWATRITKEEAIEALQDGYIKKVRENALKG
jgi:hypothetical protein